MSTPLEFDEKKFWIALFPTMAQRETTTVNAMSESFVPSVSSGWRVVQFKTGIKKGANPQASAAFFKI
jgi:hypothetical protein